MTYVPLPDTSQKVKNKHREYLVGADGVEKLLITPLRMGKRSVHIDPIVVSTQSTNFYNDLLTIQYEQQIKKNKDEFFFLNSKQDNVTDIPEYLNKKKN